MACEEAHGDVVDILLAAGADVNAQVCKNSRSLLLPSRSLLPLLLVPFDTGHTRRMLLALRPSYSLPSWLPCPSWQRSRAWVQLWTTARKWHSTYATPPGRVPISLPGYRPRHSRPKFITAAGMMLLIWWRETPTRNRAVS
jgi:hypothetical protein